MKNSGSLYRHRTCRVCRHDLDAFEPDTVKYGVRHYAHVGCFLRLPDAHERYLGLARCPREKVDAYRGVHHRWILGLNAQVAGPDVDAR